MQEHVSVANSITKTATDNLGRQLVSLSQLTSQLSKTWMSGIPRISFYCFLSQFLQVLWDTVSIHITTLLGRSHCPHLGSKEPTHQALGQAFFDGWRQSPKFS